MSGSYLNLSSPRVGGPDRSRSRVTQRRELFAILQRHNSELITDMSNSGDLVNERSKAEYERGYATLLEFL